MKFNVSCIKFDPKIKTPKNQNCGLLRFFKKPKNLGFFESIFQLRKTSIGGSCKLLTDTLRRSAETRFHRGTSYETRTFEWLCGVMVRASDLWSTGCEFDSRYLDGWPSADG